MWKFSETTDDEHLEARYWNSNGRGIAIVASITKRVDWAAYIGVGLGHSEMMDCLEVADFGHKLSEADARHFFPDIQLPYRN